MIEILAMSERDVEDLLRRVGYGHFACSRDHQPYVVPINYVYEHGEIYIYTTAGLKSEIVKLNPLVCLQVEENRPDGGWRSVVVTGEAHLIVDPVQREMAVAIIRGSNPSLLPALALKWKNDWLRTNVEVVYSVKIKTMTGLTTSEIRIAAASACPVTVSARSRANVMSER